MKQQYEDRTRWLLPRRTYTVLRCDGKAFHTFTRRCEKPYDARLAEALDVAALALCREAQGACFAYIQSDEMSVLLHYTRNGLGRFPCHHVIGKAAELLADDTLEFHHVDGDDAKALEARNDADYSAGPSP